MMKVFYKNGFYLQGIHSIPESAVEISKEIYDELMKGQSQGKTIIADENGSPILIEPQPSPCHILKGSEWVIDENKQQAYLASLRQQLSNDIDNKAADISTYWTRFINEYQEREAAALAFKQADYQGEPSVYITSFSSVAGLDNQAAVELILKQAAELRSLQEQLAIQRMRKYELKNEALDESQLQAIYQDIINKMNELAEKAS
nr:tail fiber assembly protein [Volucribacter psittacicida]